MNSRKCKSKVIKKSISISLGKRIHHTLGNNESIPFEAIPRADTFVHNRLVYLAHTSDNQCAAAIGELGTNVRRQSVAYANQI